LAKAGSFVRTGEVVARIDAQASRDHVDDVQSTVVRAESDVKKRKAEQAVDWENLQQTLRVAKAQLEQARLDNSAAEVRTTIDQELLKLAVEEAEARYKQLQADLALKQAAHKSELRILEITRDRHALHRDRHANDLKRFTFRAPTNGLVVMQTFHRGGDFVQIEVGDQVRSGQTFMKIVDTSSMQLETDANQAESSELRVGQPATILLDAFPELRLKGKVYSIGAMGVRSWRENYYVRRIPVRIAIEGSDPRLIPDLSASAEVIVERTENALTVPLEAVQSENGRNVVFVKKGDGFERREVELGLQDATHTAVTAGLEAGEELALEAVVASSS
jgi:multidrug efflux pump subunit AcrA (membrane-fusion protein)